MTHEPDETGPETMTTQKAALRALSRLFFILALAGIAVLLGTDIVQHFRYTDLHARLDAWPLIAVGLSYITLQIASDHSPADRAKGIFLGIAFLLWGGEQLIDRSRIATLMDEGAVTIFVIDVSLIIWSRLTARPLPDLP